MPECNDCRAVRAEMPRVRTICCAEKPNHMADMNMAAACAELDAMFGLALKVSTICIIPDKGWQLSEGEDKEEEFAPA